MILRPYQAAAKEALWDYIRHNDGNPMIVLPTGAGKSPLMASIAQDAVQAWGGRVGVLAHTQELVSQNADKLLQVWPEAPVGIYSASLRRRDRFDPILHLQIQSVHDKAHKFGKFDLLLVDEAHRIPTKSDGMYRRFIREARRFNPKLRVIGLSATPYRLGAGPVCGHENVLNEIVYEARIPELIDSGFLSPLRSIRGRAEADLSSVRVRGGEYVEHELAAAVDDAWLIERAVSEMLAHAQDRQHWIVFCVSVEHAEHVSQALQARGIESATIHGNTPKAERAEILARFQAGTLRALCNVNVLTEGFDAPHIDCVVMLRPTKSPGLFYQMAGRGFRKAPGKADCLVLDFAGNTLEHGPVDAIRVSKPKAKGPPRVATGQAKECPVCAALLPIAARQCECGHAFGLGGPTHFDSPIDAPILSTEETEQARKIMTSSVNSVRYERHEKVGKPPSLRVTYQCGLRRFSEWVCIEHTGIARAKAVRWWQERAPGTPPPRTIEEALPLAWSLPTPVRITIDETNKFPEITKHEFSAPEHRREEAPDRGCEADGSGLGVASTADPMQRVPGLPEWVLRSVEGRRSA